VIIDIRKSEMIFDNAIPKKSNFKIKSRLAEAKNGFKKQKIKKVK